MKVIRDYGADGRLAAAGYAWGEPDALRLAAALAVYAAGLGVTLFGVDVLKTSMLFGVPVLVTGLGLFVAAYAVYQHRFRPRSLIFEADGRMSAPQRLPEFWWPRYEIRGHHDQVVRIAAVEERRPDGSGMEYRAAIYFRSGNIVRVSGPVHRDDAHKIAVQLTLALEELRDALADPRAARAA